MTLPRRHTSAIGPHLVKTDHSEQLTPYQKSFPWLTGEPGDFLVSNL
jgi:hypothetical protein